MRLLFVFLALAAALAQEVSAAEEIPVVQEIPEASDYPRVNGSTSTALLGSLLAARALGFDVQLRRVPTYRAAMGKVELTLPLSYEPRELERWREMSARSAHLGTHKAYVALAEGKSDVILVARPPSPSETALLEKAGITLDVRPFALDAFVFLVNVKNPVRSLSVAQLRGIFTGRTRLWRALGGEDVPIMALSRPRDSGSEELLGALLLKGEKAGTFPVQNRLSEMGETIERVAANRNAIGYSVFYFEHFMMPDARLRSLGVDGVVPTPSTIAARTYPFTTPVLCVTRAGIDPSSSAARLRDWLLSDEGQKLVAQSGYVPLAREP
jgi:ABC-type phosphate transport system substrate-binding protein